MQNAFLVRGRESGGELARNLERLFIREIPDAFDQRCEVLSIDVLHREKVLALDLFKLLIPRSRE